MTFEQWFDRADAEFTDITGITLRDVEDLPYYDMWESGETPKEAAYMAVVQMGGEHLL